jgi:hypothetical protein
MNIDKIKRLQKYYASQAEHIEWNQRCCVGGVLENWGNRSSTNASPHSISTELSITYAEAEKLFWLRAPDGIGRLSEFNHMSLAQQKAFLHEALETLMRTGEVVITL